MLYRVKSAGTLGSNDAVWQDLQTQVASPARQGAAAVSPQVAAAVASGSLVEPEQNIM